MNKLIKILVLVAFFACFSACDYVSSPYKQQPAIATSTDTSKVYKNVLVEDYTGINCGNCPYAADELDSLIRKYGNRIVPMAVNAGSFADPPIFPSTYNIDFTCSTGETYNSFFGISSNPNGMINRKGYPQQTQIQTYGNWDAMAYSSIQNDTAFIKLTLSTTFDTTSRNLSIATTTKFLKTLSGKYNLVVLLTQDSIIAPQLRYGSPNNEVVNYAHRFALRDAINSTWGDTLVSNGATLNKTIANTYSYIIKATYGTTTNSHGPIPCDFKQCYVVAYVYNTTTYEVLQSMLKKIYK